MKIHYGKSKTEQGPGVTIELTGDEVALAIDAYLVAHGVNVSGPRTVTVNKRLCKRVQVYVDPSGDVVTRGVRYSGRGQCNDNSIALGIDCLKQVHFDTDENISVGAANSTTWTHAVWERHD